MQLILDIPDEVLRALPVPREEQQDRLQTELACLLYAKDWLSLGQAARMAGMDHHRFGLELGERNIARHYSTADVEDDLAYASRQQHVSRL